MCNAHARTEQQQLRLNRKHRLTEPDVAQWQYKNHGKTPNPLPERHRHHDMTAHPISYIKMPRSPTKYQGIMLQSLSRV